MNALCKYIVLFLFLTAFAEASSQYRDTVYVEQYGDSSSIFIFRGCRENVVRTPGYVPSNETQGQLLAHVYGSEPLKDSTEIYRDWATSCDMVKADRNVAWPIVVLGALYGVPATYFGAHLFSRDYDYKVTKGLGYVGGGIWFVTGVAAILAGAIAIVPALMRVEKKR